MSEAGVMMQNLVGGIQRGDKKVLVLISTGCFGCFCTTAWPDLSPRIVAGALYFVPLSRNTPLASNSFSHEHVERFPDKAPGRLIHAMSPEPYVNPVADLIRDNPPKGARRHPGVDEPRGAAPMRGLLRR